MLPNHIYPYAKYEKVSNFEYGNYNSNTKSLILRPVNFKNGTFEFDFEWDNFDRIRHNRSQCWELALVTDIVTERHITGPNRLHQTVRNLIKVLLPNHMYPFAKYTHLKAIDNYIQTIEVKTSLISSNLG